MTDEFDGHFLYSDSTLNHIFIVMIECIMIAGGDGSGVVVSSNYEYYAYKFEEYLRAVDSFGEWSKHIGVGFINYSCDPEDNISFISSRELVAGWEEIVVELM